MGRLTLNVLLSFAQFEREVTGERIRDKIAASKKKGMWMGGNVPLGYDVIERKLVVNKAEAETVRKLFGLYLEFGSAREVMEYAERHRLRPKAKRKQDGECQSARNFGRAQLYYLLSNSLYVGLIRHKSETYPGMHDAIIERPLWDGVQAQLSRNRATRRSRSNAREPSLLTGLLFASDGSRFTPSHAVKNRKRYRYYVDRSLITGTQRPGMTGRGLPADEIEAVVLKAITSMLQNPEELLRVVKLESASPAVMDEVLRSANVLAAAWNGSSGRHQEVVGKICRKVILGEDSLLLEIGVGELSAMLSLDNPNKVGDVHSIRRPLERSKRRGVTKLVIAGGAVSAPAKFDPALIKAIVRAHKWWAQLNSGVAVGTGDIAKAEGVAQSYVSRVLRLAFLDPEITGRILDGRQPTNLTAWRLIDDRTLPILWRDQRQALDC
jgi:hypothetical protein